MAEVQYRRKLYDCAVKQTRDKTGQYPVLGAPYPDDFKELSLRLYLPRSLTSVGPREVGVCECCQDCGLIDPNKLAWLYDHRVTMVGFREDRSFGKTCAGNRAVDDEALAVRSHAFKMHAPGQHNIETLRDRSLPEQRLARDSAYGMQRDFWQMVIRIGQHMIEIISASVRPC